MRCIEGGPTAPRHQGGGAQPPHPHRRLLPSSLSGLTTPGTSSSSRSGWHRAAAMLSHQAATGQVRGCGGLWARGWAPGDQGTGECSVTAQRVAVGCGKTRDAMWGGSAPSAITGTLVLGAKGMRMAGDILLCCSTITATITATATAPHVAPAAGAACQGWTSGCLQQNGAHSASCWVLSTHLSQHCACSQAGSIVSAWWWATRSRDGLGVHPMVTAKKGQKRVRQMWVLPAGKECPMEKLGCPTVLGRFL